MATPVRSDQDFGGTSRALGLMPTPGKDVRNTPVTLNAGEQVVLAASITLDANTTGRVELLGLLHVAFGAVLVGSMGAELRVYRNGAQEVDATVSKAMTATLALAITFDLEPVPILAEFTGLAAGVHNFEVRAVRTGAASTVTVTGRRTLSVKQIGL